MDEHKLNTLIQQAVDGIISDQERSQLEKILEQNPQLKHRFIQMKHVTDLLNRVGVIEPPPDLKDNILKRIDEQKYKTGAAKQRSFHFNVEWLYKPKPRIALAFCSGIILGGALIILLLSGWFSPYTFSNLNLMGTIGMSDQPIIETLYEFPYSTGEFSGGIKVNRFDRLIWFDLNFSNEKELEIMMDYDPGILYFDQSRLIQSTGMSLQESEKQIRISSTRGGRIVVFFVKNKPTATAIGVTVRSAQATSLIENFELN